MQRFEIAEIVSVVVIANDSLGVASGSDDTPRVESHANFRLDTEWPVGFDSPFTEKDC